MTASKQAKTLGAKSLKEVAEFYECTVQHLNNVHNRNNKAFAAMVRGFVSSNELLKAKQKLRKLLNK